jgi:hypothetical protein
LNTLLDEDKMEIKIGDLIQSDTGACGVIIALPDKEKNEYRYIMHWNQGEDKEWGVDEGSLKTLIKYSKWKVIPG